MKAKYEIVNVGKAIFPADVSLLKENDEISFNATDMAKPFGKRPDDFWKQSQNKEYLDALITLSEGNYKKDTFISTKRGKCGGTYFHKDLALQYARWLNPVFGVRLDKWTIARLQQERDWKQRRLESKTGFLPMTNAVLNAHDPVKSYHYSNEIDMINKIVLGMRSKDFKQKYGVEDIREYIDTEQLSEISRLQIINTGLIEIGMAYKERKENLEKCHKRGLFLVGHEKEKCLEI